MSAASGPHALVSVMGSTVLDRQSRAEVRIARSPRGKSSQASDEGRASRGLASLEAARKRAKVRVMASVKVPSENQPLFFAALPNDPRVETIQMFGGIAAKVNGRVFAGLFGRSSMVLLPEPERSAALELEGAAFFDPMGDGRARSEKVMLPESVMHDPQALTRWLARAFQAALVLPPKPATRQVAKASVAAKKRSATAEAPSAKKKFSDSKAPSTKKKLSASKAPSAKEALGTRKKAGAKKRGAR